MKKNLSVLFITVSICLMIQSCKEKSSDDFFAGKTQNVYYSRFNPELTLPHGNYKDSIDLYADSKYELKFETLAIAGETGYFTLPAVWGTKDLNILLDSENKMPKALSKGEIISIYDNWSSKDSLLALYYYPSPHSDPVGYWKDQKDKYLGIKYKNKLGWTMITTTINAQLDQFLIIKELGIEK